MSFAHGRYVCCSSCVRTGSGNYPSPVPTPVFPRSGDCAYPLNTVASEMRVNFVQCRLIRSITITTATPPSSNSLATGVFWIAGSSNPPRTIWSCGERTSNSTPGKSKPVCTTSATAYLTNQGEGEAFHCTPIPSNHTELPSICCFLANTIEPEFVQTHAIPTSGWIVNPL